MGEAGLKLLGVPVVTAEQAEVMRVIRNQCRLYMTRNTNSIGPDEQLSWWLTIDKRANRLFLFKVIDQPVAGVVSEAEVGYGLCRLIGGKWWLSGGLRNEWQGKGLGKQLFGFLAEQAGLPVWLEALEHNTRAVNTYTGLGFREVSREGGIITMVKQ